jgi:hypothetical protein
MAAAPASETTAQTRAESQRDMSERGWGERTGTNLRTTEGMREGLGMEVGCPEG